MARASLKKVVVRLARTRLGRRIVEAVVLADPEPVLPVVAAALTPGATFDDVAAWPPRLRAFDDLVFLFSSNRANAGIASLAFDEAAYLYRTVAELPAGSTVVEIGRFKGGSTFLIAAAVPPGGALWSYDPHVKLAGGDPDGPLRAALARYGLDARVRLVVGDSATAAAPPGRCALVFVDGDHSYEGARADYLRWRELLEPGGHLLFHDAAPQRPLATYTEGVLRLVGDIEASDDGLMRERGAGSLVHFRRRS